MMITNLIFLLSTYFNIDFMMPILKHIKKYPPEFTASITNIDLEKLSDLIAIISNDTPPIGTTCEIGIYTQMIDADPKKNLYALYDDCREGFLTCQGEVGQQKLAAMQKEPGEAQMSYVNIFLTGAIKTHGKLVCSSDELIKVLKEDYRDE